MGIASLGVIYAALISTVTLGLEVRRWVESRARVRIDVQVPMKTVNVPGAEGQKYVMLTATNVGNVPTTITGMIFCDFRGWYSRWRKRPETDYSVLNPALPGHEFIIPKLLKPGEIWQGFAIYDEKMEDWLKNSKVFAGVFASHSPKMLIVRMKTNA